jgi:multicomponent K+:H+ antiporter subunit D
VPKPAEAAFAAEADWLLPLALTTSVLGVLGALAAHSMGRLVAYLTVSSVGTILAGVGLFTPETLSAALYYTLHSTVVIAGLFLLVELMAAQRGDALDKLRPAARRARAGAAGVMMIFGAASAAGLPPLAGLPGQADDAGEQQRPACAGLGLDGGAHGVGFLTIVGLARAGVIVFWHVQPDANTHDAGRSPRMLGAAASLMVLTVLMAVFASPIKRYTDATAQQLVDKALYAETILKRQGGVDLRTTLPYDGSRGPFERPEPQVKETE